MYAETSGVRLALGGIGGKHRISSRRDRFFYAPAALRSEQAMEIEADGAFLVQEVMETIKYNSRLQGAFPVPSGDVARNGRQYHISIEENHRMIEGVEMREVSCTVTDKTGTSFSAVLLLEAP